MGGDGEVKPAERTRGRSPERNQTLNRTHPARSDTGRRRYASLLFCNCVLLGHKVQSETGRGFSVFPAVSVALLVSQEVVRKYSIGVCLCLCKRKLVCLILCIIFSSVSLLWSTLGSFYCALYKEACWAGSAEAEENLNQATMPRNSSPLLTSDARWSLLFYPQIQSEHAQTAVMFSWNDFQITFTPRFDFFSLYSARVLTGHWIKFTSWITSQ